MLTLKDLKEYDIRDIDVVKFAKALRYRRDFVINGLIVLVSVFAAYKMIHGQSFSSLSLDRKIALYEEKNKAIANYDNARIELEQFLENFPSESPDIDTLISQINSLANSRGIQIQSLVSSEGETTQFLKKKYLKLTITAADFKRFGMFVRDIEKSSYPFRIDRCAVSLEKQAGTDTTNTAAQSISSAPQRISADMTIAIMTVVK